MEIRCDIGGLCDGMGELMHGRIEMGVRLESAFWKSRKWPKSMRMMINNYSHSDVYYDGKNGCNTY